MPNEGFFHRLKKGLGKTRDGFVKSINDMFTEYTEIDDDFYEELEEILIMGDIGVSTTESIIEKLKDSVKETKIKSASELREYLIHNIKEQMAVTRADYEFEDHKSVVLVVGVNGVGKTTTVGKLASKYKNSGHKVVIAAADTFRAAASEQLNEWALRAGTPIVMGQDGADPAAVVYDSIASMKAKDGDILLIDTAGRLHNKKNLMMELHKISTIIDKEYPEAMKETFIVLDGTTGQNALQQAREFKEVVENITGIVITKLDGTAKGGIAIAIQSELGIPVKYIGVGEGIDDLQEFDPDMFVRALFNTDESGNDAPGEQ